MKSTVFASLAGAVLSLATGFATAGPVWDSSNCVTAASYQSATCTSTGTTKYSVTTTGWSALTDSKFTAGYIASFDGGLGVVASSEVNNYNSPQHAVDNNGSTDAILMSFGTNFALKQLTSGWIYGDADVSILRYTGSAAPVLTSSKVSTLSTTAGWELVGNYSISNINTPLAINAGNLAASWWLVSAYNASYGGNTAGLDNNDDYFKLKSFSGDIVVKPADSITVPEPGTWSLMGFAMLGLAIGRRKLRT